MGGISITNKQLLDFSLNMRYNTFAVLAFIALFLVIGPFLPGGQLVYSGGLYSRYGQFLSHNNDTVRFSVNTLRIGTARA